MVTAALGVMLGAKPALAAGTPAGTSIDNQATASFDGPSGRVDVPSNTVSLRVDELLDVTVTSNDPGDVVVLPGATGRVHGFTVTNNGNGSEAFRLFADVAVTGDNFDPTGPQLFIDSNGNGAYDAGVDTLYVPNANEPVLAPDAAVAVFLLSDIPGTAADSQRAEVQLTARAATGSGTPGTSFAGQGSGGGDAIVGSTGADGLDSGFFRISTSNVALTKAQLVLDPFGGSRPVPGAVITYTLTATITGSGTVTNLVISDPVPPDTQFVPGSLLLDSISQTDVADGDAGSFSGTGVSFSLGTITGAATRTAVFQVRIE